MSTFKYFFLKMVQINVKFDSGSIFDILHPLIDKGIAFVGWDSKQNRSDFASG